MSWRELAAGAPNLAHIARERLDAAGVALLGTLRPDGWPRISPVGTYLLGDELVFGLMPSPKLDDLRSDARCLLHSAVADGSGSQPEAKLYGRAVETRDPDLLTAEGTWWASRPTESVAVFILEIDEAVVVAWDPDFDRMRTTRWARGGKARERERHYP